MDYAIAILLVSATISVVSMLLYGIAYFILTEISLRKRLREVTQCIDCQFCELCHPYTPKDGEPDGEWFCNIIDRYVRPDHFCGCGLRRPKTKKR